jgi:hypothetical protein
MQNAHVARIDEIEGIDIDASPAFQERLVGLVKEAASLAAALSNGKPEYGMEAGLPKTVNIELAITNLVETVNALLAEALAQCHLSTPPEDIEMKLNEAGRLIYRCYHTPPHEWDLGGNPLP